MYPIDLPGGWELAAIPFLPLLGAMLNGFLGKRLGRQFVSWVGVLCPAIAFGLGLTLFLGIPANEPTARFAAESVNGGYVSDLGQWIAFAGFESRFRFVMDHLSAVMVLVITGVGTLIHIYSTSYMSHEDRGGFARYFAYLNLFVAAMLVLVLAGDLLLMFVGWEGVGLCSYLLIGFHYRDEANAACGSKAFIVNRIGDLGFVLGMFCLLAVMHEVRGGLLTLDISAINHLADALGGAGHHVHALLGLGCLLLFVGATGKSAQIPLHLWLPDAMAGPTPVSALIHAATMVTAGVYMISRLSPVFHHAEVGGVPVLGLVAVVGVMTAFCAGAAALAQDDIKRVLAYSTVSQLGYMFVGVGAGAFGMAMFHLVTHAFFKALLFLGAGAVIHATHTQSMRQMGGLRRSMPLTFLTMGVGALALGGFPLLSGFWSKDGILGDVLVRAQLAQGGDRMAWVAIYGLGTVTAAITALYSMRLVCLTFLGEPRGRGEVHEAPFPMAFPLLVLALATTFASGLGLTVLHFEPLSDWVAPAVVAHHAPAEVVASAHGMGLFVGVIVALGALGLGYTYWNRDPSLIAWEAPRGQLAALKEFLARAWLYDDIVNKAGLQPLTKYTATQAWRWVDDFGIDNQLVDGTAHVGVDLSHATRALQTGRLSRYAGMFAVGAVILPLVVILAVPALHAGPALLHGLQQMMGGGAAGH